MALDNVDVELVQGQDGSSDYRLKLAPTGTACIVKIDGHGNVIYVNPNFLSPAANVCLKQ